MTVSHGKSQEQAIAGTNDTSSIPNHDDLKSNIKLDMPSKSATKNYIVLQFSMSPSLWACLVKGGSEELRK